MTALEVRPQANRSRMEALRKMGKIGILRAPLPDVGEDNSPFQSPTRFSRKKLEQIEMQVRQEAVYELLKNAPAEGCSLADIEKLLGYGMRLAQGAMQSLIHFRRAHKVSSGRSGSGGVWYPARYRAGEAPVDLIVEKARKMTPSP